MNVRSVAFPNFATSWRRRVKHATSPDRCRVAAVYVVLAVMVKENILSSRALVKITHCFLMLRRLKENSASARPSYSTTRWQAAELHTYLPTTACERKHGSR